MLVYWFLPMILLLGIVTSYEDIKFGNIRNKWILLAIAYSVVINIISFPLGYNNLEYLLKVAINGLISLIIGFIIWYANLWTAGDAKLFFAFALLLPLEVYGPANLNFFPSALILYYAFVPFAVLLFIVMLFKVISDDKLHSLIKNIKLKDLFQSVLFVFAVSWLLKFLLELTGLKAEIILTLLFLIVIFKIVKIFNFSVLYISLPIVLLRFIFDRSVFSINSVLESLALITIFILIRFFLLSLGSAYFTKNISIGNLEEGMEPAENIAKFTKKFKKAKNTEAFFKPRPLSANEIIYLKKTARNSNLKYLKIHQTISFSPFLFMAAVFIALFGIIFKY